MQKYALTKDNFLVEQQGEGYINDFHQHFTLWTGHFLPFFKVIHVDHPEDSIGWKEVK